MVKSFIGGNSKLLVGDNWGFLRHWENFQKAGDWVTTVDHQLFGTECSEATSICTSELVRNIADVRVCEQLNNKKQCGLMSDMDLYRSSGCLFIGWVYWDGVDCVGWMADGEMTCV